MLDFATQKKLLDPILKNPKNHFCADCDSISPTWASLDFGVFLCSNCSGAHRGLGPTITRVRSATLDKWQQEWIGNMQIGNTQLNIYWEGDNRASQKKPKLGSTLNQIGRYVFQKYVKKKYVKNPSEADPLTSYKNGTYNNSKNQENNTYKQPQSQSNLNNQQKKEPKNIESQIEKPKLSKVFSGNLLQFDLKEQPNNQYANTNKQQNISQNMYNLGQNNGNGIQNHNQYHHIPNNQIIHEDDDFTDFAQAGSNNQNKTNENFISFDKLLGQQNKPQNQIPVNHFNSYQDLKAQNLNVHHPYNPMLSQNNLVYQAQYHNAYPQQHLFQNNPNIMPHYASHSLNHYNYQQPAQPGHLGMPYQNMNGLVGLQNQHWK